MKYLLLLFLYHLIRKIEGMMMSKITKFGDSLTLTLIMFLAEISGGFLVSRYQKVLFKKKEEKTNTHNKITLIQREARLFFKDSLLKIYSLIFFAAFFDFAEFIILCIIPDIAVLSKTCDSRICIIITITSSLLCSFALKIKTGRHQHCSLIAMGFCSFIIFIIELIYKSKGVNFGNFISAYLLVICRLIFVSYIDVVEKYLVETNHLSMYKILGLEGCFGFFLCFIYALVMGKNPFLEIDKVYKGLGTWEKALLIFFLILYFILCAAVNIYKIMCNVLYNPMIKSLTGYFLNPLFIIYYFIYENDFLIEGEKNFFYFIINLILSVIINILGFIYNEFFIVNCCGLQKDTHFGISKRALENELIENWDDDNSEKDINY